MSKDTQKTYDSQTGHFLGLVAQNMPNLSRREMQQWIEHPARLQQMLALALSCSDMHTILSTDFGEITFWTPMGSARNPSDDLEFVPLSVRSMKCVGEEPFGPWEMDAELQFGVEYNPLMETGRHEFVLRPYIEFQFDKDPNRCIRLQATDVFRGAKKLDIDPGTIMPLLERGSGSVAGLVCRAERQYISRFVELISNDLETRLACSERRGGWEITLTLFKDRASYFTTTFWLSGSVFMEQLHQMEMEVPSHVLAHAVKP